MAVDSSLVDRIVRGVLQGLEHPVGASPPPPARPRAAQASTEVRLDQRIITADVLKQHVPRNTLRIVVTPKAILTPAALDVVRAQKIVIDREAARSTPTQSVPRRLAITVRTTPVLDRLLKDRTSDWRRELLGCPDEAATLAISSICRGDAEIVVIFAAQAYRAACLANRNDRIKAVAVGSVDDLRIAREQLRVNVICVDPTNRGDFEIRRWLDAVVKPPEAKSQR